MFAKSESAPYTRDALAAAQQSNGAVNGHGAAVNGHGAAVNGSNGVKICPGSGLPCDCGGGGSAAAEAPKGAAGDGDGCCGSANGCGMVNCCKAKGAANGTATTSSKGAGVEPIFPPELKGRAVSALQLPGELATWYRPTTLEQLLALKAAHPELKLVGGNSEVRLSLGGVVCGLGLVLGGFRVSRCGVLLVVGLSEATRLSWGWVEGSHGGLHDEAPRIWDDGSEVSCCARMEGRPCCLSLTHHLVNLRRAARPSFYSCVARHDQRARGLPPPVPLLVICGPACQSARCGRWSLACCSHITCLGKVSHTFLRQLLDPTSPTPFQRQ